MAARSPSAVSDFSLVSCFDVLSLGESSSAASSRRPSVAIPIGNIAAPDGGSLEVNGRATGPEALTATKSAARRARRRKLEMANSSRQNDASTPRRVPRHGSHDDRSGSRLPLGLSRTQATAPSLPLETPLRPQLKIHLCTPTSQHSPNTTLVEIKQRKKTRRAGKKIRARKDRAAVRDLLCAEPGDGDDDDHLITPQMLSRWSPAPDEDDDWSEDGASRFLDVEADTEEELEEDEVDDLSVLDARSGRSSPAIGGGVATGGVMSRGDAKSSIDSFLTDSDNFMLFKANKLRLWQALCIELGLVALRHPDAAPEADTASSTENPTTDEHPDQLPPVPQTLNQARNILKTHAHINLVDYLEERRTHPAAGAGSYRHLVYASAAEMMKSARKDKKLALMSEVKREWLEPLLRDFGIKKSKTAA